MVISERKTSVLVVDDEKIIRDLCEKALKEYTVFQAGSLREGLEAYSANQIDVVLTDVMMPGGSGIDLLKTIKASDPGAVVIVMTGFGDKEVILSALREDADDFINKPLQLLQLRTAVQKALSKKALKEELSSLRRLESLKSSFLSLISHKLKTPITSLSLGIEDLKHYAAKNNQGDDCQQRIAAMGDDVVFLNRLVSSLLRFYQAVAGVDAIGSTTGDCDLDMLMCKALELVQQTRSKPDVEIVKDLHPGLKARVNCDKLVFALQQVIDNAFAFTESGKIMLDLHKDADSAIIMVRDTGCGIAADELPKVFEKFYQVDPDETGQVPGFGLGLFYAREFLRQQQGTISIESEPGKGTTVLIKVPLSEANQQAQE